METLIHKATGELVYDDPFIVEGTRIRIIKKSPNLIFEVGTTGTIDARSVGHTKSQRKASVNKENAEQLIWAVWDVPGYEISPYYIEKENVKVIN